VGGQSSPSSSPGRKSREEKWAKWRAAIGENAAAPAGTNDRRSFNLGTKEESRFESVSYNMPLK